MNTSTDAESKASLEFSASEGGELTVLIRGRLDSDTVPSVWKDLEKQLERFSISSLMVDASGLEYCDVNGSGLLIELLRKAEMSGKPVRITGLAKEIQNLLDLFDVKDFTAPVEKPPDIGMVAEIGMLAMKNLDSLFQMMVFVGQLTSAMLSAFRQPWKIRWKDALLLAERVGVDALPIVSLVGFLMGLILAFQSAIPMKQFGADVFVATLVSSAIIRELGPLMTAILLAGRTGSAYAAELGTMKVNEELDALNTMGLDPVNFLVVTRVLAAVVMTPLLTVYANLIGTFGGSVVFVTLGYPQITYWQQVAQAIDMTDVLGGLFKSVVFGLLVAAIGCLRGTQTGTGASAVGLSATQAVVSGIVLIVAFDGIFAVIFYYLGI